jgi:electron transport complex protein RnfB
MSAALIPLIDALLPQTQCGKCGHAGCLPYAEELSAGGAINKCPPGGSATIHALAELLGRPVIALDPAHGSEQERRVAFIREAECIGCTKCIQACPVDAIMGASKRMHTVISAECTGCDLCVAPCPVDCIDLLPLAALPDARPATTDSRILSQQWRGRYHARTARLKAQRGDQQARREALAASRAREAAPSTRAAVQHWTPPATVLLNPTQARLDIAAAVERAKARKAALQSGNSH